MNPQHTAGHFLEDYICVVRGLRAEEACDSSWWKYADLFDGPVQRLVSGADPVLRRVLAILVAKHFPEVDASDYDEVDAALEWGAIGDFLQRYFALREVAKDARCAEWRDESGFRIHAAVPQAASICRLNLDGTFDHCAFFSLVADLSRYLPNDHFLDDPMQAAGRVAGE
jgi:hypothetical protein